MWRPCPLHAAPLPSCRQPACCLSSAELPRDPVMPWKRSAYRKQCDTCTRANTHTHTHARVQTGIGILFMCVHKHRRRHMKDPQIETFLPLCPTDGFPRVHWDVRSSFWNSTSIFFLQRQFWDRAGWILRGRPAVTGKDRQETDSFSTLGKSEEEENEQKKTDTHGVWRNNTPLNCWAFFRIKAGYFSGY